MMSDEIRKYLEFAVETQKRESTHKEWKYISVEDFVLQHGREFESKPVPSDIRLGKRGDCFYNAYNISYGHKLIYVEGFAQALNTIHHAFCLDADDGLIIDPTKRKVGTAPPLYFGVPIKQEYVFRILYGREKFGILLNPEMGHPLLTGEHHIDEVIME